MNRLAINGEIADPCGVPRSRATRVPSACWSGALSHRSTYSKIHCWPGEMWWATALRTRSQGTVSKNARMSISITQSAPPAPLPACRDRVQRRLARPVAVGVWVEHGFHLRLQIQPCHRLGNPVSHGRHAEQTNPRASCLRDLHRLHRRREIGARRHPVPDLVQVPVPVRLELGNRLLIDPRRALVGLDPLERFPDLPFGDLKRLVLLLRPVQPTPPGIAG